MAAATSDAGQPVTPKPSPGLSAFISRVLDQLSLSAWLPAIMLVGSLTVLGQMHRQDDRSFVDAATIITHAPWGAWAVLLAALILTTTVTQAFEFEVIRLLEGYWGDGVGTRLLARFCVWRQGRTQRRLAQRRDDITAKALERAQLVQRGILPSRQAYIVEILIADAHGWQSSAEAGLLGPYRRRKADAFDWLLHAEPALVRRIDAIETRIDEFPQNHRLLPTRLGNILRSVEDRLDVAGSLESLVIERWDRLPSALRQEHDQYRTRLDMYCTLVFVFAVLAGAAPALLTKGSGQALLTWSVCAGYLALMAVSYAAALASARGYGTVLIAINSEGVESQGKWRKKRPTPRP